MKWASAISTDDALHLAVDELAVSIEEQLDGAEPDLVVAFVSPHHRAVWDVLPDLLADRFPTATRLGCSGGGTLGAGREVEDHAALAASAAVLPGVAIDELALAPEEIPSTEDAAMFWKSRLGGDGDPSAVLLLPEPFSCSVESLIGGLDVAFPGTVVFGGLASGARRAGSHLVFHDRDGSGEGAVGVALRGDLVVETLVAQGCRPVGVPMFVTGVDGTMITSLDGQRPVDVLHDLFMALDERDQELLQYALFIGLVMRNGLSSYGPGDFLIRNLMGVDPATGALGVAERIQVGQVVQFHLRDAATSAADLEAHLAAFRARSPIHPAGALMFSCLGRGEHLYGHPGHDTRLVREALGPLPMAGFFCNGEIGPVQGRPFLHGYTNSIAFFRPR